MPTLNDYYAAGVKAAAEKLAIGIDAINAISARHPGISPRGFKQVADAQISRENRHRGYMGLGTGLDSQALKPQEIDSSHIQEITNSGATRPGVVPVNMAQKGSFSIPAHELGRISESELWNRFGIPVPTNKANMNPKLKAGMDAPPMQRAAPQRPAAPPQQAARSAAPMLNASPQLAQIHRF